jgi:hypothetical protein
MSIKNYFILGLVVSMGLTSCKKDDSGDPVFDAPYADASVEENKASLEDAGVEMINEMEAMMDAKALDVASSFSNIAENLFDGNSALAFTKPLTTLALLNDKKASTNEVFAALKSTSADPGSMADAWADAVGRYEWNNTTDDWDYTSGGNAIVIEFPGLETDATNTAIFTVNNFDYVEVANMAYEEDLDISGPVQMPTSLKAGLTYKGDAIMSYSFSASYTSDGIPTSLKTSLDIDGFVFSIDISHSVNSSLGMTYSFKHDSKTLIEVHADASGNWSEDNIEDNTETVSEVYTDYYGNDYYDEWDEVYFENILSSSNAYIQILNIKVAAKIDIANFGKKMRALDDKYDAIDYEDTDWEAYTKEQVALLNQYAQLVVVYADNNKKIAVAEAYAYEYEDYYGSDWSMDVRFIFADGSKADAESYFDDGFGDLIDDMNDLITELNTQYDLGIEAIDK